MYQTNVTVSSENEEISWMSILDYLGREMIKTTTPAVLIAVLVQFFLGQTSIVQGKSMEPNLHTNQLVVLEKVSYQFRAPERGEIVVVQVEGSPAPLIKRVIGLPGETLTVRNNQLFINGIAIQEPYLSEGVQTNYGPIQIPESHIFVMGDNRASSNDSRYFGPVPIGDIIGRAWLSYWPLQEIGPVD